MATGSRVTLRDLPAAVRQAAPPSSIRTRAFDENASPLDLHATERRLIAQALSATKGNITAAAKKLGISRRTLHRKINELKETEETNTVASKTKSEANS
jgi:transcriptional regulator of acetoin/glycerol metabolism